VASNDNPDSNLPLLFALDLNTGSADLSKEN